MQKLPKFNLSRKASFGLYGLSRPEDYRGSDLFYLDILLPLNIYR